MPSTQSQSDTAPKCELTFKQMNILLKVRVFFPGN